MLAACDTVLALYIGPEATEHQPMDTVVCQKIRSYYEAVQQEIFCENDMKTAVLKQCFENRKWLCEYLTIRTINGRMYFRDSLMVRNVVWFREHIYNDEPFIVWTANTLASRRVTGKHRDPNGWENGFLKNTATGILPFHLCRVVTENRLLQDSLLTVFTVLQLQSLTLRYRSGNLKK